MPVEFEDNSKEAMQEINNMLDAKLEMIGQFVSGEAIRRAPSDSAFLRGQISYKVFKSEKKVRISANTVYAAMQEFGGVIKPVRAKALSIPIHPLAKNKEPGDFKDLVYIPGRNGKHPILARKSPKGRSITPMFVLVKRATIPAQPYLRPAVYENKDKIMELLVD